MTADDFSRRVSANIADLLKADGRKIGEIAAASWPELSPAAAYRRLRRLLDDGWGKPGHFTAVAGVLDVDESKFVAPRAGEPVEVSRDR